MNFFSFSAPQAQGCKGQEIFGLREKKIPNGIKKQIQSPEDKTI